MAQIRAAAITMVRDDPEFLALWLRHYGTAFGRENCYIVNHGREPAVAALAAGCNLIGIPGDPHPKFDAKRWRLLNGLVAGLSAYTDFVVVGDVDELVVADPASGLDLLGYLATLKRRAVHTPLGLEVIHRPELEPAPLGDRVLGPRRHVRLAPHYSKPCVLGLGSKIARGGHFTQHETLSTPEHLYLLHLKYCDLDLYRRTMDRRNALVAATGAGMQEAMIGRHWFAEARGEDAALFADFARLEMRDGFRTAWARRKMHDSWAPRENGLWAFARPDYRLQYRLPERFDGLV
ncbi:glycosyltransferase family 2 protein [Roseivivax sp. CAU 1761]